MKADDTGKRGGDRREARRLVRPLVADLEGYVPGEQTTDSSIVKLNTNENPYPPGPRVRAAIENACGRLHLYPDPTARALRERMGELCGADPEGIVVGNGSDELLTLLIRAAVGPGEPVAYPVPTYSLYDTLVALQDGVAVHVPFPADYSLPRKLFEVAARLLIVCNPNAPSGTAVPTAALDDLAASRDDVIVVVDEAYVDFAAETAVGIVARRPNVVVLRTLSKSYSLAGLRVGFGITSPSLAAELGKVKDSYNVGTLAQAGALAALEDQETMREHVARVRATRTRLERELASLGFESTPSQTNFVLARRPGESLAGLTRALKERGVLVRHFASLPDAIRITVGTDAQIDRLLAELRALNRR